MAKKPTRDPKTRALQQEASLHPHPEQVTDELFLTHEFFDPRDLVQVKYEMLRRVQSEGQAVSQSAAHFGFSRPSFYQAQSAFQDSGLAGLLPRKRGPRAGHKLTAERMQFVTELRLSEPGLSSSQLADRVGERFGVSIHPRSIDRQLRRQKKLR